MSSALSLFVMSGLAVISIYLAIVFGELISTMNAYLYLHNELGVPETVLRMSVLAVTVLPVAFVVGRAIVLRSPGAGRTVLMGVAVAFTTIIGLLQIVVYDWSVLGASLLKITFAVAGLMLVAYRYRALEQMKGLSRAGPPEVPVLIGASWGVDSADQLQSRLGMPQQQTVFGVLGARLLLWSRH